MADRFAKFSTLSTFKALAINVGLEKSKEGGFLYEQQSADDEIHKARIVAMIFII